MLTPPVSAHDHVQGPAKAPVTLVEFGDFECPYCGAAYPVVKQLQRLFKTQMRFVFRHFPLTQIHPHAEHAAEAAEAVGAQGKFWEMHDTIFEHQEALRDADLVRYGASVGVDPQVIIDALATHAYLNRIKSDFMSGVRSGVNGTPTFFINGEKYDGAYDLESLREAINAEIESAVR
jgi:protein-disulfide isomerase